MELLTITTEASLRNSEILSDGHYNISKHGHSFYYDDMLYTYISSGLARCVYRSECGKFVIKVPIGSLYEDDKEVQEHLENNFRYADPSVTHNVGEARAYAACPDDYKTYLAKTELLPNCWIRQEFVDVLNCSFTNRHDLREIGRREDGSFCIFDYDPLLDDFAWSGNCNWERIARIVVGIRLKISGL